MLSEFSTIDTTILVLGAKLAGNYFGGRVAQREHARRVEREVVHHDGDAAVLPQPPQRRGRGSKNDVVTTGPRPAGEAR